MSRIVLIWVRHAAVVAGAVLLTACASRASRVECERRLEPINAPAKAQERTKDGSRVSTTESKS